MAETFQPIRAPVCRVIMDLAERRKVHDAKRRSGMERAAQDVADSWLVEQDRERVVNAIKRLAERTGESSAQAFVNGLLLQRSKRQ